MRYHGRRLGLHPKDENTAWECDSYYDFHEDHITNFVNVAWKGADPKLYEDSIKAIVDEIARRLKHGKKYLCGDQITTADFVAAHAFFSWVYNENYGRPDVTEKGKAAITAQPAVAAYCEVMRKELAPYLATKT